MTRVPTKEHTSYLQFQTSHYSFQMNITKKEDTNTRYHFIVGNPTTPCLEGLITLESKQQNNRYKQFENKAKLIKIDALEECAVEDISTEYLSKYSFGQEMLDAIVFFINSQFPQIKTVSLDDTSYIPCNRATEDTLDLLTYSIALYKKTWYEERLNAYLEPKETYINYRNQVEAYASKETKSQMSFEDFQYMIQMNSNFAYTIFYSNLEKYSEMYRQSETFPEFFQKLSRTISRNEKCRFFKDWLFSFIKSKVTLERTWYFDLYPKITVIQQTNMKPIRNTTRKRQRKTID